VIAFVPFLAHDVFDFGALDDIGRHLFAVGDEVVGAER